MSSCMKAKLPEKVVSTNPVEGIYLILRIVQFNVPCAVFDELPKLTPKRLPIVSVNLKHLCGDLTNNGGNGAL